MNDYKKTGIVFLLLSALATDNMSAAEAGDSLIFQNQSVSGNVSIQNPSIIRIKNSTVKDKGHLKVTSTAGVVLDRMFEVQKGGTLEINFGPMSVCRYVYDSAGNVKSRKRE